MRAWMFLILAIFTEVSGTSAMKFASGHAPVIGHLVMYLMIGASYFLLSLAVKRISLGLAYALWEGFGLILITAIGFLFFGESMGILKICGILLILSGILMLKMASYKKQGSANKNPLTA